MFDDGRMGVMNLYNYTIHVGMSTLVLSPKWILYWVLIRPEALSGNLIPKHFSSLSDSY